LSHDSPRSILAHQFDDLEQQLEADRLGMWAFLATEVMFFGGLFVCFTVYRTTYPRGFAEGARHLKLWLGAVNTAVLLSSSLTVVLAVHSARHGRRKLIGGLCLATILLGAVFLSIKATEYLLEYREGLVPLFNFTYQGPLAREVNLFLRFYFIMTAIHALHMIIGIGVFSILAFRALKGRYTPEYHNPVEVAGLYWHFVDLVWIFLFPVLYLLQE
jgi:cytochrome c oxidase subunit 3